jgi:type I restriction enzyme S subunit
MSVPTYPATKDSGVEWLGEVPAHWGTAALKRLVRLQSGEGITSETIEPEGTYPVFGGNGHRGFTEAFTHDGDFVLVGRQGALCGNINYASGRFWASEHALVAHPLARFEVRWLGELLRAMNLGQYSVAAAQPGLSADLLGNLRVPIAPPEEQAAIAAFLDRETGKIDALVEEQRRLIALLKEKRQAVISHAVTRGLNPQAPLKPSGIEWLGDIPTHWEVRRLKRLSPQITVGIVVNPSEYVADEGLPFIYGGDISEGLVHFRSARRISPTSSSSQSKTMLAEGDLLTVRVGAPGVTAVVPRECAGGNCASVMLMRKGRWPSQWLCYAMNSRAVRYQVELVQYGAAQEQFNISHATEFMVPTPPAPEASEIACYLDARTAEIDELVVEAERGIALFQERRAALISAAVTGKIDVRGLVATPGALEAA